MTRRAISPRWRTRTESNMPVNGAGDERVRPERAAEVLLHGARAGEQRAEVHARVRTPPPQHPAAAARAPVLAHRALGLGRHLALAPGTVQLLGWNRLLVRCHGAPGTRAAAGEPP